MRSLIALCIATLITVNATAQWIQCTNQSTGVTNCTNGAANVGIGTTTPGGRLHVYAAPTTDVFGGFGMDMTAGPSFNLGYGGATFGRGAGFLNVRPDASAIAP